MAQVIGEHRPYSVFHAAAHKHVPLMEANVAEAVLNNVLGTQNVRRRSATSTMSQHFVLISTDKAVRPTSVMGATKRVAEQLVHECALRARERLRLGALRQRARQPRERRPDVHAADRRGRAR